MGFALGLAMSVNQVAIVASPLLLGWLKDTTGSYMLNWSLLIAVLAIAVLVTGRSHRRTAPRPR